MKKIAIVCTLYPPYVLGGAELSTQNLVKGLVEAGQKVIVITSGERDEVQVVDGVKIYRLRNRNLYWRYPQRDRSLAKKALWHLADGYLPLYKNRIKQILKQERPDVVHTGNLCGIGCDTWEVAHKLNIPVVHTLRDYALACPQQTMYKGTQNCTSQCATCKAYTLKKKILSGKVDAVVGISDYILRKHLMLGYFKNAKHTATIYNSVKPFVTNDARGHCRVGYIGRLSPEKGIELLIDAFKGVDNAHLKLLIGGDGNKSYTEKLHAYASDDRIEFRGKVNARDFMQSIDLLVVPSLWAEPFGRVVIEAYSAHCPLLIAKNGGLNELIKPGISYGFDTSDPRELTKLLKQFGEGQLWVDNSLFDRVLPDFSTESMTRQYMALYDALT